MVCVSGWRPEQQRVTHALMETFAGKDGAKLDTVKYKWHIRRSARDPIGKKLYVFAPLLETHFSENACAFTNSAIVIAKDFNPPGRQKSSPADPGVVGEMPFGSKCSDKQNTGHRVCSLMQYGIKVSAGNREVTGQLRQFNFC